jgi:histidinol dehydrogenase
MRIIRTDQDEFDGLFRQIGDRGKEMFAGHIWESVRGIVDDVARRGDEALFEYTARFDGYALDAGTVEVTADEIDEAASQTSGETWDLLTLAAGRIERFHQNQVMKSWSIADGDDMELGQRVTPLEHVGIYAPGGLAAYPSTVLMASVPARIAGVEDIILVTPVKGGKINPLMATAAKLGGITRIFRIGGAQAIAALAYGTASIPRVDKIVGPGNAYVAMAKKLVYGQVGIDMIAGPSEVLIIADGHADAALIAADLLAQAEHDEMASAVVVTPDEGLARRVAEEVEKLLATMERSAIAVKSIATYGAAIVTRSLDEAVEVANRFSPEHLGLMVEDPGAILDNVKHAGAIFLGYAAPEAMGDYIAGPNHILPTGGTARFASPLSVYDFVKRTSILSLSRSALERYGEQAMRFARLEGLTAHERSVSLRLAAKKP